MFRGCAELEKIDDFTWRIPKQGPMRTEGILFANETLMKGIRGDECVQQVMNVACLPGIVGPSIAMPDIHWGYGFPIGGVAAFDSREGVVSPGGVGYDINCGVRLIRTHLEEKKVRPQIRGLIEALFREIPAGVGSRRHDVRLSVEDEKQVLSKGVRWAVENGFGEAQDLERIESHGTLPGADPSCVSQRSLERGRDQLGTLGSGNHFLEIEVVQEIFDLNVARAFGLFEGQVVVHIHSGSRGLGYQICDDYIEVMLKAAQKYKIDLPDRQLCCAPLISQEAQDYLAAMSAAANYAFCNRQLMTHFTRRAFEDFFKASPGDLGMEIVYDVAHNIAKMEDHVWKGEKKKVCVHRKGATRAFPANHPELTAQYQSVGQPVFIPGDMGRYSYVLVGEPRAMEIAFGSCCHGAGRVMSRMKAKKASKGRNIFREMEDHGIIVRSQSLDGVREEISEAYKDVADVVDVVHHAGLARKVAKLCPMGVIKG